MSERKRKTEESIEDVQRVSDILNKRIKKINKLGAPSGKDRNPFLNPDGGFDLIDEFVPYEKKIKRPKIERS